MDLPKRYANFFRPAYESNLVIGTGGSHEHRPTNNAQGPFRWSGLPTLEQPGTGTGTGSEGQTRQRHVGRRSPLAASPAQRAHECQSHRAGVEETVTRPIRYLN